MTEHLHQRKITYNASLENKYRGQYIFFLFSSCFLNLILLVIYLHNNSNSFSDFNFSRHNDLNHGNNINNFNNFNNNILYSNFSTIFKNDNFLLNNNCCTKNEYINAIRIETFPSNQSLNFTTCLFYQTVLINGLIFLQKLLLFFQSQYSFGKSNIYFKNQKIIFFKY